MYIYIYRIFSFPLSSLLCHGYYLEIFRECFDAQM